MKIIISVLALLALVATLHAAAVPSYTWPTFKSNVQSVDPTNNMTVLQNFYSDANKKMLRFDVNLANANGAIQKYIQFYEVDKYTIIYYTVGKDDSIVCNFAKMDTSSMFGNMLKDATYEGLKALNSTVGLSYQVPAMLGAPAPVNFVIDAFTNYPAMVAQKDNAPSIFINAAEFFKAESDAMLRIPTGITCKDVTSKIRTTNVMNMFKF